MFSNWKRKKQTSTTRFSMVYLHMTNRCNYNCWYCYNKKSLKNEKDELSTSKWLKIIDILANNGAEIFVFTGGEPLMRKDLPVVIHKVKKLGKRVHLLTNGSLLLENNVIEEIIDDIDEIVLSLDSQSLDIQNENRSNINFDKILEVLAYFSKSKHKNKLSVRSVITKKNANQIAELRNFLKVKFNIEKHITVKFIPNNINEIDLVPVDDLFDKQLKLEYYEKIFPIGMGKEVFFGKRCYAGGKVIAIDYMGNMYPCQNFVSKTKFIMGNILDKIWFLDYSSSSVKKKFDEMTVDKLEKCNSCQVKYMCGGGCPAISNNLYGDIDKHVEYQCEENMIVAKYRLTSTKGIKLNA